MLWVIKIWEEKGKCCLFGVAVGGFYMVKVEAAAMIITVCWGFFTISAIILTFSAELLFFFLPSDRIFDLDTVAFFLPLPCKSRTKDFLCCFYQEIPIDSLCSAKAWPLMLSSNPWSSFARFLKHYWRTALKLLLSVEVDLGTFWSACLM